MKRIAIFILSALAGMALAILVGLVLFIPDMDERLWAMWSGDKRAQESFKSLEKQNKELVTVRYRVHALYCIDKQQNRIQLGPVGVWPVQSFACWSVSSDVLAGFNWSELKLLRKGNDFFLQAPEPAVLGMDFKNAALVYSKNWSGLTLNDQDFLAKTRPALVEHAEKLGIREDAQEKLKLVADLLSRDIGLPVKLTSSQNL